ncbi:MAG: metallophosphoesterase [Polyangiaceae bacterium]|nr:metallophosphoesterase [Polyangiaceae bacterium]
MGAILLHLSDLHFGPAETKVHWWNSEATELKLPRRDRRGLLGSLVRDLEDQKLKPDVVVVSGDLLDQGSETGVRPAIAFLKGLAQRLELPPERFVLTPGNHDPVRGERRNRYARYDTIHQALFGKGSKGRKPFDSNTRPYQRVERVLYDELGLEILSFNSTVQLSKKNRHGSIGQAQLDYAATLLGEPNSEQLRIAVMHHHLRTPAGIVRKDAAKMDDAELTLEWLAQHGFALVLHGHQRGPVRAARPVGRHPFRARLPHQPPASGRAKASCAAQDPVQTGSPPRALNPRSPVEPSECGRHALRPTRPSEIL